MTCTPLSIALLSLLIDLLLALILLHAWRTCATHPSFLYWVAGAAKHCRWGQFRVKPSSLFVTFATCLVYESTDLHHQARS